MPQLTRLILLLLLAISTTTAVGALTDLLQDQEIPHTDPDISYLGRFLSDEGSTCSNSSVSFGWSSSSIRIKVSNATAVSATLTGGSKGDRFLTLVDGTPLFPFPVSSSKHGPQKYNLVKNLEICTACTHTIELVKITEDNVQSGAKGAASFSSFHLTPPAATTPTLHPYPTSTRLIHFIGDSDTAGWCADGTPSADDDARRPRRTAT